MRGENAKPAVFVDRDNTLIEDPAPGYIREPDQVRLLDGAPQALQALRRAGFPIVLVTNQSAVARGYLTEQELAAVHQRLQSLLRAAGAHLDAIYYCPFLDGPEAIRESYRRSSDLRKPKPGMLKLAAAELNLDLKQSWMIGDSDRDVQAGKAAGCRTILLANGHSSGDHGADFVAPDLSAATRHILSNPEPARTSPPPRRGKERRARTDSPPEDKAADDGNGESSGMVGSSAPAGTMPDPPAAGEKADTLQDILEEFRMLRRERQQDEFSLGRLAGAVAQAFAVCAIGWGLFAAMNGDASAAMIRLLSGIGFQLIAMTWLQQRSS